MAAYTAASSVPIPCTALSISAGIASCCFCISCVLSLYCLRRSVSSLNFACISGLCAAINSASFILGSNSAIIAFNFSASSGDSASFSFPSTIETKCLKSTLVVTCSAPPPKLAKPFLNNSIALSMSLFKSVSAIPPLPVGFLLKSTSFFAVSAPGSPSAVTPASSCAFLIALIVFGPYKPSACISISLLPVTLAICFIICCIAATLALFFLPFSVAFLSPFAFACFSSLGISFVIHNPGSFTAAAIALSLFVSI